MMKIGCHLSSAKGFKAMGEDALKIGANTFQFFTRNPRGSRAKDINPEDAMALNSLMAENGFHTILAHAPYTLNPCGSEEKVREFAHMIMADDLQRMEYIPNSYYNFHPGSHMGQGAEQGAGLVADLLNAILTEEGTTTVLLETMAGKGTEIGRSFEELKSIMDKVVLKDRVGVCLDTCHVYDAGYDIVNDLDGVVDAFDRIIGLDRLLAIHLNDSKNPFESHKDRHEKIGEGTLGLEALTRVINHPRLRHLPFFLETPNELDGHAEEIKVLKSVYMV